MKLIIAGGRDYKPEREDRYILDRLHALYQFTTVLTGGATGADAFGESWATDCNIPARRFPADWDLFGKKAGPLRNAKMAREADACICFPGGAGTDSMAYEAKKKGLLFWDFRGRKE